MGKSADRSRMPAKSAIKLKQGGSITDRPAVPLLCLSLPAFLGRNCILLAPPGAYGGRYVSRVATLTRCSHNATYPVVCGSPAAPAHSVACTESWVVDSTGCKVQRECGCGRALSRSRCCRWISGILCRHEAGSYIFARGGHGYFCGVRAG
jgi:hypothetical protein